MTSKNRDFDSTNEDVEGRRAKKAAANRARMIKLRGLLDMFPKLWRMPKFKMGSKSYPHHNTGECARRRKQLCFRNQVIMDERTKRQPE